jgi:hypothetical protein
MYNRIWNWYFRVRSDKTGELTDSSLVGTGSNDASLFGKLCARLPSQFSEFLASSNIPDRADSNVTVSSNEFSVIDFAKVSGQYESEILRAWFGNEYKDIMDSQFGANINTDADERPTLCWHNRVYMSGYDVDGTDQTTLGSFSGKSVAPINIHMPRKFFPEHGLIMIMQLMRFPTIHEEEHNYLVSRTQFDYEEISGDPQIIENSEPVQLNYRDIFATQTASLPVGYVPASWFYRSEPSYVQFKFDTLGGFPFLEDIPQNENEGWYHEDQEYADMFQTNQLGHYRSHIRVGAEKMSPVPPAIRSIYAGV